MIESYYIGKAKYYKNKCKFCGKDYEGTGKIYCSKSCRAKDTGVGNGVKTGKWVECIVCKKTIWRKGSLLKKRNIFYCSKKCLGKVNGERLGNSLRGKPREKYLEEGNPNWKGDEVGYEGLHGWVRKQLGKPTKCIKCNSMKNLEWANKSREYKRDVNDWLSLCRSCHAKYDQILKNRHRDSKGKFIG
jgi:hypothetical protein